MQQAEWALILSFRLAGPKRCLTEGMWLFRFVCFSMRKNYFSKVTSKEPTPTLHPPTLISYQFYRYTSPKLLTVLAYSPKSFLSKYFNNFLLLETKPTNPRLECLSLGWTSKWTLNASILTLKTATCTGVVPVSVSCRLNSCRAWLTWNWTASFLLAFCRDRAAWRDWGGGLGASGSAEGM